MQKRVAIISAKGIGDGLLMMILSQYFLEDGYLVSFYHRSPHLLEDLFPKVELLLYPKEEDLLEEFQDYDLVLLQNDHSSLAFSLFALREEGKLDQMLSIFPKPSAKYLPCDFLLDPQKSMVMNLSICGKQLLGTHFLKKDNGIAISPNHIYRHYPTRVIIHPTSGDSRKNWSLKKFLSLAKSLKKLGFHPEFAMSPQEKEKYISQISQEFPIVTYPNLRDMANYIYESGFFIGNDSGLGHLASAMRVPTLTITGNKKNIQMWKPDWSKGQISAPLLPLPNFKGIGLAIRDKHWQKFLSVEHVLNTFQSLNCVRL